MHYKREMWHMQKMPLNFRPVRFFRTFVNEHNLFLRSRKTIIYFIQYENRTEKLKRMYIFAERFKDDFFVRDFKSLECQKSE